MVTCPSPLNQSGSPLGKRSLAVRKWDGFCGSDLESAAEDLAEPRELTPLLAVDLVEAELESPGIPDLVDENVPKEVVGGVPNPIPGSDVNPELGKEPPGDREAVDGPPPLELFPDL